MDNLAERLKWDGDPCLCAQCCEDEAKLYIAGEPWCVDCAQRDEINYLRDQLADAREQVAGAYLAAANITTYHYNTWNDKCEHPLNIQSQEIILALTPSDAKAVLEARDARMIKSGYETGFNEGYEKRQFEEWEVRAEERAKVIEEAKVAINDYPRVAPDGAEAQHYDEQIEYAQRCLDSLRTTESRALDKPEGCQQ